MSAAVPCSEVGSVWHNISRLRITLRVPGASGAAYNNKDSYKLHMIYFIRLLAFYCVEHVFPPDLPSSLLTEC